MGNQNIMKINIKKEFQNLEKINEENKTKINELEQKFKTQNKVQQQINQIKKKIENQIKDLNQLKLEFEKKHSDIDEKKRKIKDNIRRYENIKIQIQNELNLLNEKKKKYQQLKVNSKLTNDNNLIEITNRITNNTKKENQLIDIISKLDDQLDLIEKNREEYYLILEKRKKNIEEINEEIKISINNILNLKINSFNTSLKENYFNQPYTTRDNYNRISHNEYNEGLIKQNEELKKKLMEKDTELRELTKNFQAVIEKNKKLRKKSLK